MGDVRLDKYVAAAFGLTRKTASQAVRSGGVKVNGTPVRDPARHISSADTVLYGGEKREYAKYLYIILDKPAGVLSASRDASAVTVCDLVKDTYPNRRFFPAGRLDRDSTGLILLTDDGDFAHAVISPRHKVEKEYIVDIDCDITPAMIKGFADGVELADGTRLAGAILSPLGERCASVIITQGVYHQIKRMFGVYGAGVTALRRVRIGGLRLDDEMGAGNFRELSENERETVLE